MLPGIFVGYVSLSGMSQTAEMLEADVDDLGNGLSTSDVRRNRFKSPEIEVITKSGEHCFTCADGVYKQSDLSALGPAAFVNPQDNKPPRETSMQNKTAGETSRLKMKRIPTIKTSQKTRRI